MKETEQPAGSAVSRKGSQEPSGQVSVIIPVLNEAENIEPLLGRLQSAARKAKLPLEVIFVDGGSTDGTQTAIARWVERGAVRLVQSAGREGLARDVLKGAAVARSDVVVVMDGDLSHAPEALPRLVAPVLNGSHDMSVGSRRVAGGGTENWPWHRALISWLASVLAWPLVDVKDPTAGYFALGRRLLLQLGAQASGFKIGLEVLARGAAQLRVVEVPITFVDRTRGRSKLGLSQVLAYVQQIFNLAGGAVAGGSAVRFAAVGLLGVGVDALLFNLLLGARLGLVPSHMLSFLAATVFNYMLNSRWAFRETASSDPASGWVVYSRFLIVCLLALFLRGAVLGYLVEAGGWEPSRAILMAIAAASAVNFVGCAFFIFPTEAGRKAYHTRWRVLALGLLAYSVMLRVIFAGLIDLLPEEAYYWQYSEHLSLGYLDHPPMVAWLIRLGTWLAEDSELGVRLSALVCWGIAAIFLLQLARDLYDKTVALVTVMLLAGLPIYFATGMIMTPDAPLYAAWAGCLYFLQRALLGGRPKAWMGAGVCLGLGMLSKYTIATLGPAVILFLLLDKNSRHWLLRKEPYLAAGLALLLFTPVIYWNMKHGWASFVFQGPRRWQGGGEFGLHALLGSVLIQLGPMGAIWMGLSFWAKRRELMQERRLLFAAVFTLLPLSVFIANAVSHMPKLNWTGPVWLAALPLLAAAIVQSPRIVKGLWRLASAWKPALVGCMLLYAGFMYYLVLGFPGMPKDDNMSLPVAWKELGREVENVELEVQTQRGQRPVVVGMDKYFLSSEMSFYDPDRDGAVETSGRHLFGRKSLMWRFWQPKGAAVGRHVLMVSFKDRALRRDLLENYFTELGPLQYRKVFRRDIPVGGFYYRVGYNYIS